MALTGKKPSELDITTINSLKTILDITKGYLYVGEAIPATNPNISSGKVYYYARTGGTYTNFGGLTLNNEEAYLMYNGSTWSKTTIADKLKSQNIVLGKVISGCISAYSVVNGSNTERWVRVFPNTIVNDNTGYGARITLTAGNHLISSSLTSLGGVGATIVWCTRAGAVAGIHSTSWNTVPQYPVGDYVFLGITDYAEYQHQFTLKPYIASDHVIGHSGGNLIQYNPEYKSTINISEWGFIPINSYVTGYNYKQRANVLTVPELVDKNYYVARCEVGTTSFTNFTNNSVPYSVTFSEITCIALKYDVATGWSHTVLPYIHDFYSKMATIATGKHIVIPAGIYLFNGFFINELSVTGESRETSHIMNMSTSSYECHWSVFKNISLYNYFLSDYYRPCALELHNCRIVCEDGFLDGGSTYLINLGFYNRSIYYNHRFINTIFNYDSLYTCIWGDMINHLEIVGCRFEGNSISHPIRIAYCSNGAEIAYNYVKGGVTGIFFGSTRIKPIENVNVHNNEVCYQLEEGISFDGFGNNWDLCPVICNGLITSVSNDSDGRIIVIADHKSRDSMNEIDYPISSRTDWTNFYFVFEEGSGLEGVVCKIHSYDAGNDSLTLDCLKPSNLVTIGGFVGVHSGFFNCMVKDNIVHHVYGGGFTYGTALSIYLNVVGFTISGNRVYGCGNGINLAGGRMLTTYETIAYNNNIIDNWFIGTKTVVGDGGTIRFISYYGGKNQYGNRFVGNTVYNGYIVMNDQFKFSYEGNNIHNCVFDFKNMQNVLPTASADYLGKKFMLFTNDINGNPTDIKEYVCKLTSSVYSWSEL